MFIPSVQEKENAALLQKLSVIGLVHVHLTSEELAAVPQELVRSLAAGRTLLGPFTSETIEVAAQWLDKGVLKVLVHVNSTEDAELERVAAAVSTLPASRVVLRLPLQAEELQNAEALQSKLKQLQTVASGVVLAGLPIALDVVASDALETLKTLRKGLDEGFLVVVEPSSSAPDQASQIARIAELHFKNIHVLGAAQSAVAAETQHSFAAQSFIKCLRSDRPDGLFTTVVADQAGVALGLVYSSEESVLCALESGRGVYYSRSRQGLWKKGESSGNTQKLLQLDVDCDSDALRFTVEQTGDGFCHLATRTCWGEAKGLAHLEDQLVSRLRDAPAGSYTKRLFNDPTLLRNKLVEEAQELAEAETVDDVAGEAADVLYFAMVRCVAAGVTRHDIEVRTRAASGCWLSCGWTTDNRSYACRPSWTAELSRLRAAPGTPRRTASPRPRRFWTRSNRDNEINGQWARPLRLLLPSRQSVHKRDIA